MGTGASASLATASDADVKAAVSEASPEELSAVMETLDEEMKKKLQAVIASMPKPFNDPLKARVSFTAAADEAVKAGSSEALLKEMSEKLKQAATELRQELPQVERMQKGTMLTLLNEQVHTARGLPDNWADELKVIDKDGTFTASCAGVEQPVGGDFPPRQMLVVTPFSRLARKAYFEAASQGKMVLWHGPPGTGKTESFRDMAYELGMTAMVCKCKAEHGADEVKGCIDAAKAAKTVVVFDEAHYLSAAVWEALAVKAKEAGIMVGCTYWLAYEGGTPPPKAVEEGGIALEFVLPQFEYIVEVMAGHKGFVDSEALGKKVVAFMEACKGKFSGAHHDFGLRAVKCLLESMGAIGKAAGYDNEMAIAAQAALRMMYPKLGAADREALKGLLSEHFGTDAPVPEGWPDAVTMLKATLEVRHGALMLGVLPGELDACVAAMGPHSQVSRLPGTMTEKSAGDFVAALETTLKAAVDEDKKVWVVIDVGETKDDMPAYLEKLHTLLDDNKYLLGPGGEKVSLPAGTRIVLVANEASTWGPAAISRLGVVLVENPHTHWSSPSVS